MKNIVEHGDEYRFANGQSPRDLRDDHEVGDLHERTDPGDGLEALRQDSDQYLERRIESPDSVDGKHRPSGGSPLFSRSSKRVLLLAMLILALGAIAPFAWNYIQSYESTDDAQIDGHIDPLSSRINGTVIRVHAEDNDRVKAGELLVEIDPRDYEVAVAQARARLELALAQVASAKQDYAAALANTRETDADNFRAQRDAQRFSALLDQRVVAQNEYDQYTATARVDSAKVDSAREAAGSALKTIAARQADADAAKAALDQALLNLSYTKIHAPANGIVGRRTVELGSRIEPGQTLMFVTETDEIWVTADFKETQLARMHRGEKVTIHVDTFGRIYTGYVRNLPGASGDRFSLLPAENATGNYVKVVQRLPVRIEFNPGQDPDHLLHPGMSVEPSVWLR
ncbi:HlyD family secretion protein [Candidatus Binatus sp.]|uniref:HlyD family secretion protein n=1 Tax=Candidatus Binatus sp. TaxID=2811406 RepID=UPI003CB96348